MATITVSSGQTLNGQVYQDGTNLTVTAGGVSTDNFVGARGTETVYGSSFGDTVSGSYLIAEPGAVVSDATVLFGIITVISGSVVSNTMVSGGTVSVAVGATAYTTTVSGGSIQVSGTLSGFTLQNGSAQDGDFGELVSGTIGAGSNVGLGTGVTGYPVVGADGVTVLAGGRINVALSIAVGTVLNGGSAFVDGQIGRQGPFRGAVISTTILNGGVLDFSTGATESGTVIGPGGLEIASPNSFRTSDVISGGTLELFGGDPYDIVFAGSSGTLLNDSTGTPAGVISGFNTTDRIILVGLPADPNARLTTSGNTATVTAGGNAYELNLLGASSLPLTLGIGTNMGNIDIGVACYCAGTAILTAEGERAVESIAPGDLVITADGRAEPVLWVGHRSYAGRFLQRQPHLLPIRIRAGALGRRLPRRDLLVSPNHALLLDGVLVPAAALVDGHRITVEHACTQADYIHLELVRHDIILAEGTPAETFLDDDSRSLFQATQGTPGTADTWCAPASPTASNWTPSADASPPECPQTVTRHCGDTLTIARA